MAFVSGATQRPTISAALAVKFGSLLSHQDLRAARSILWLRRNRQTYWTSTSPSAPIANGAGAPEILATASGRSPRVGRADERRNGQADDAECRQGLRQVCLPGGPTLHRRAFRQTPHPRDEGELTLRQCRLLGQATISALSAKKNRLELRHELDRRLDNRQRTAARMDRRFVARRRFGRDVHQIEVMEVTP